MLLWFVHCACDPDGSDVYLIPEVHRIPIDARSWSNDAREVISNSHVACATCTFRVACATDSAEIIGRGPSETGYSCVKRVKKEPLDQMPPGPRSEQHEVIS